MILMRWHGVLFFFGRRDMWEEGIAGWYRSGITESSRGHNWQGKWVAEFRHCSITNHKTTIDEQTKL